MPTILLETALSPTHIYISLIPISPPSPYTLSPPRSIFRRLVQTLPDILICLLDSLQETEKKTDGKPTAADTLYSYFTHAAYNIAYVRCKCGIRTVTQGQVLEQYSIGPVSFPEDDIAKEYKIIIIINVTKKEAEKKPK